MMNEREEVKRPWMERHSTAVTLQLLMIFMLLSIFVWAFVRSYSATKTNQTIVKVICEELVQHRLANEEAHRKIERKHGIHARSHKDDVLNGVCRRAADGLVQLSDP